MARMSSAHEVDSDISWPRFPGLLQEVFQWKPKPKGKKQKSQIDDTRTEISYSASTGGDADFETSTYVSDLGAPSNRSVESRKSKKRSKKSLKDATSGSVFSDAASSPATPDPSNREATTGQSNLVTLNCPLCYDPDCILNKAAQCPLLRHNEPDTTDCCKFCRTNCQCEENKKKLPPVSGLVQRDENGIAVTLLKANGGPIENSYEWANRRRWDVPSHVRWEHKISEWITAPTQGHTKAEDAGHRKRPHKLKNKRKSKATPSALTATPEITSNSEEPRIEEDDQETKVILDGNGFKIFSRGREKILINYDRKNCKYMGCNCQPMVDSTNCGCGDMQANGEKSIKHRKKCAARTRKISLLRETSHGMEPMQKELEAKFAKEKTKSCESAGGKSESIDKCEDPSGQKLKKAMTDKKETLHKPKQGKTEALPHGKVELSGKDLRNQSRADILEASLRHMLGDDYKNDGEAGKAVGESHQPGDYVSVPCPGYDQNGAVFFGDDTGTCNCAQTCWYPTYL